MHTRVRQILLLCALLAAPAGSAAAQDRETVPEEWLTPAEAAGFEATPSHDETLAFLRKIQTRLPEMELGFFGSSAQGRPLPFVVVSKEKAFTARKAQALAKPILLIQSSIHGGEVDGKDATLMILRDMALGRHREILDALTLVFVPVYNADGHERFSPYNRPNQDGPRRGMGFRTTADGHDLNRDFLLARCAEVARDPASLTKAVQDAEAATVALGKPGAPPSEVAVVIEASPEKERIRFPVYASEMRPSLVTGGPLLHYRRGEVREIEVPIAKTLPRPRG
jgi:murein tripeptide amidase MpaA